MSFRRVPLQTGKEVLGLYPDKYLDLKVRHFHEKLREEHDLPLGYRGVYQALVGAGLVRKRRRRGPHRRRRERRPIPGCCCILMAASIAGSAMTGGRTCW